ncbi:MAG: Maf family protein [Christensenellaceae bacterium]|jgi:septum formation protein|nr:Maf family protein [Christensenellaceae bacterium]
MRILLASESPRRKELLKAIFLSFDVYKTCIDENYEGLMPEDTVKEIAKRKLRVAVEKNTGYELVIAADTLVYCNGLYLGKPKDKADAIQILTYLEGKTHEVYSGIAINFKGVEVIEHETSNVKFHSLTQEDIENYIATHDLLDKAGAYAIQDGVVVECFNGSFSNIMGLPISKVNEILIKLGAKS